MKNNQSKFKSISFSDRIVAAILSAIFAGITLVGYFFMSHSWRISWNLKFYSFRDIFSSDVSVYIMIAAALLGFLLGTERMSNIFGLFWGSGNKSKDLF